jgi:hypothetical protein
MFCNRLRHCSAFVACFCLVVLVEVVVIEGGDIICPDELGFDSSFSLYYAMEHGRLNNLALIDNYGDYDQTIRAIFNFAAAGYTSQYSSASNTIRCKGRWWFHCCPVDGSHYFSPGCAGVVMQYSHRTSPNWLLPAGVVCTACPSKPFGSVWTGGNCGWACANGFSPMFSGLGCFCAVQRYITADQQSCLQCPPIPNGYLATEGMIINDVSCHYRCSRGFAYTGRNKCTPCYVWPNMVLLLSDDSQPCLASCVSGYTRPAGVPFWTPECVPCGFNQYRVAGAIDTGCTQVTALSNPGQTSACAPGQYYVIDSKSGPLLSDNSWISCVGCTRLPTGSYFIRDSATGLTASPSTPDVCNTTPCPLPSVLGSYTFGCQGTSPGYTVVCSPPLPVLYIGSVPCHAYYVPHVNANDPPCSTDFCEICDPGYYNKECTTVGATTSGVCVPCAPVLNGRLLLLADDLLLLALCPYVCNSGFFRYDETNEV